MQLQVNIDRVERVRAQAQAHLRRHLDKEKFCDLGDNCPGATQQGVEQFMVEYTQMLEQKETEILS